MIMMKRFVSYLILSMLVFFPAILSAQSHAGVEKFPLKCGLMKIKNGDYYGIYDANDKVVVSVEYQDIVFVEGIAVLTLKHNVSLTDLGKCGFKIYGNLIGFEEITKIACTFLFFISFSGFSFGFSGSFFFSPATAAP